MKQIPYKFILGLVALTVVSATLLTHQTSRYFMADLFDASVNGTDEEVVYVPSYTADPGEVGLIEVKAKSSLPEFDSMSFLLDFSPDESLSFDSDALVFDETTLFQNPSAQTVELKSPGVVEVTIVLPEAVTLTGPVASDVLTHETLFKIETQVAESDQAIVLNFSEVTLANGDTPLNEVTAIPPALITITGPPASENNSETPSQDDFSSVTLGSANPSSISNQSDQMVALAGSNLMAVTKVTVGNAPAAIVSQATDSILIQVPAGLAVGDYNVIVSDAQNNAKIFEGLLAVTDEAESGQSLDPNAPTVNLDRSYTSPPTLENDGQTPFVLYAFVQDTQNDINSVVVDLSAIGQVGQSATPLGQQSSVTLQTASCPTTSAVIVCMQPSVKESSGQWFVLPNVIVNSSVPNSTTPYLVQTLATDEEGNTSLASIPVYVGTEAQVAPASALAAVSTGPSTVEVLFSQALDPASVPSSGVGFSIKSALDANDALNITGASLNAEGTIVTLNTLSQIPGKAYSLTLSDTIKDSLGKTVTLSEPLSLTGFQLIEKSPRIDYLTATGLNSLELEFEHDLKPSAIASAQFTIQSASDSNQPLTVLEVKVLDGNILELKTTSQVAGQRYRLVAEQLTSYDGTVSLVPLNAGFKGARFGASQHGSAPQQADLNGDLRVDFADFTIFSYYYGSDFSGQTDQLPFTTTNQTSTSSTSATVVTTSEGEVNTSPPFIDEEPDALVPTTSVPAGGEV